MGALVAVSSLHSAWLAQRAVSGLQACFCCLTVLQEIASFEGFNSPWYKQLLFVVLGVCTLGVLFLVAKWSVKVRTALRLSKCPLKQAKFVRVTVSGCRSTAAIRLPHTR